MSDWYTSKVEALKAQEEACMLPRFDSDVTWEPGTIIRTHCQKHESPTVISITHANSSQLLSFAASRPGMFPDTMHWVKRKEAVVLRWGMSSLRMRMPMEEGMVFAGARTRQELFAMNLEIADPSMYAFHAGGFPVRVRNVEGIVGVIVVHGLNGKDNHNVIVEGIKEYLEREKAVGDGAPQRSESIMRAGGRVTQHV